VSYSQNRVARTERAGRNAEGRLAKYVLADEAFAGTHLSSLTAGTIQGWRRRLPARLAAATVNRLLNDLRAALNSDAELHRRGMPASLIGEIKSGTKATPASPNARKQILSNAEVRRIIDAAAIVDPTGDFSNLVLISAATGARFSQLARLTVGDVQIERMRIMVPTSRKGRSVKPTEHIAVPVGEDLLMRLHPILNERGPLETLLQRWSYRTSDQPGRWERDERRAWREAYEIEKPWAATVARAGLPLGTVMLALRHSSIVRGLRAGLPVRLVGALHDTSVQMIEQHYSAYIVDATEELARRAVMSMASPGPQPPSVAPGLAA
jgi:integrase